MNKKPTWDEYYANIAQVVATRSSCCKRQIGAVIVHDNRIIGTGYNGTPRGVQNCDEGGCSRCNDKTIPSGTRLDECWCSHGEENALIQCAYAGISTKGAILYTTMSPCITCAKLLINAGISEVVYGGDYPQQSGMLLQTAGIECRKPFLTHEGYRNYQDHKKRQKQ